MQVSELADRENFNPDRTQRVRLALLSSRNFATFINQSTTPIRFMSHSENDGDNSARAVSSLCGPGLMMISGISSFTARTTARATISPDEVPSNLGARKPGLLNYTFINAGSNETGADYRGTYTGPLIFRAEGLCKCNKRSLSGCVYSRKVDQLSPIERIY